jgi:hypothetical protein
MVLIDPRGNSAVGEIIPVVTAVGVAIVGPALAASHRIGRDDAAEQC